MVIRCNKTYNLLYSHLDNLWFGDLFNDHNLFQYVLKLNSIPL